MTSEDSALREVTNETCREEISKGEKRKKLKSENNTESRVAVFVQSRVGQLDNGYDKGYLHEGSEPPQPCNGSSGSASPPHCVRVI